MFHALRNCFNKIPTRSFLGDLLITGLSKCSDFPPIYNSLIFHQTRIGWKQLFVGRFVYEWSNLQQDYLVLQRIVSLKYSGTSWITGVIQIIWKHVYQNWDVRNADLHGVDVAARESAKYAQAQRETEEIYSQRSLVQPRDWDVFYSNTNEHFQKEPTARRLRQWLNTWKPLLLRSIQDGIAMGTNRTHSICDFFPPLPAA